MNFTNWKKQQKWYILHKYPKSQLWRILQLLFQSCPKILNYRHWHCWHQRINPPQIHQEIQIDLPLLKKQMLQRRRMRCIIQLLLTRQHRYAIFSHNNIRCVITTVRFLFITKRNLAWNNDSYAPKFISKRDVMYLFRQAVDFCYYFSTLLWKRYI